MTVVFTGKLSVRDSDTHASLILASRSLGMDVNTSLPLFILTQKGVLALSPKLSIKRKSPHFRWFGGISRKEFGVDEVEFSGIGPEDKYLPQSNTIANRKVAKSRRIRARSIRNESTLLDDIGCKGTAVSSPSSC